MANHGYVKSKKNMKPEQITDLLRRLNQSHFKGNLVIEYNDECWNLSYFSEGLLYAQRSCWLKTKRTFEMRHGGGSDFAWWIDSVIINEVALFYDGKITDDGVGNSWLGEPNYHPTFISYMIPMREHIQNPNIRKWLAQQEMEYAPIEHRVDLGEPIDIKIEWTNNE